MLPSHEVIKDLLEFYLNLILRSRLSNLLTQFPRPYQAFNWTSSLCCRSEATLAVSSFSGGDVAVDTSLFGRSFRKRGSRRFRIIINPIKLVYDNYGLFWGQFFERSTSQ